MIVYLNTICCKTQYVVFFPFLKGGSKMGLTILEVVEVYRCCPVPYIQERLEDYGYEVKLSMVADMLQIVYLELELEEESLSKSLDGVLPYIGGCVGGKRPRVDRGCLPA